MRLTKVGMLLIPGVTTLAEDTTYNYTAAGHTLKLCVSNPTPDQIEAVQKQEAVFGLFQREDTLFILVKFRSLSWLTCHYNWWINAPVMRPDPWLDLVGLNGGISVSVCLVNAANGILEALRSITLSREFSEAFLEVVSAQAQPPFDPWRHAQVVDEVLREFPGRGEMMKKAFCMCSSASAKTHQFSREAVHLYC
jgi:hypothetical protein